MPLNQRPLNPQQVAELFKASLNEIVRDAAEHGIVLTVELVPMQPLAMGHYYMVADARPAREMK